MTVNELEKKINEAVKDIHTKFTVAGEIHIDIKEAINNILKENEIVFVVQDVWNMHANTKDFNYVEIGRYEIRAKEDKRCVYKCAGIIENVFFEFDKKMKEIIGDEQIEQIVRYVNKTENQKRIGRIKEMIEEKQQELKGLEQDLKESESRTY